VNLYNDCSDTSDAAVLRVGGTSVIRQIKAIRLTAVPNPSDKQFNVELGQHFQHIDCLIFDVTGRLYSRYSFSDTNRISISIDGEAGLFYMVLDDNSFYSPIKLIKR
jgi:hypothetical protein